MKDHRYLRYAQTWFVCLAVLMLGATMQGCSTLGYEGVDTTRKAIVVAVAEVRAQNLLLQDLIGRRAISQSQARIAQTRLQEAKNHLQTAADAVNLAGDPATATSNLERANISLSLAITILAPLVEDN